MRCISEVVAVLIILAIVVFVALFESGYISDLLGSQSPKGGVLVLMEFRWYVSGNKSVFIRGLVFNSGTYSVNITHVYVWINGIKYPVSVLGNIVHIKPGEHLELAGLATVNSLPRTNDIVVEVEYCYINACSSGITEANIGEYYGYYLGGYNTVTHTITYTYTTTIPYSTTTITHTLTFTTTITYTTTETVTRTQTTTATTTTTITKPAWPIQFSACYGADNYVYVYGELNKPVNKSAEIIPYVVKIYSCSIVACKLKAVVPFEWETNKTIEAKWGPIDVPPLTSIKVEVWGVNIKGELVAKIWESDVDTSVRCA